MFKKNFVYLIILLAFSTLTASAAPFKANANTKRIPAGTNFQIQMLQDITTYTGGTGDFFAATLLNEQATDASVILPAGSEIRGSIGNIQTAKRFSRGARLYLDFDHVVTPTGRQIPLDLAISKFDKIYYDGSLYKNLGYGEAIKENYKKAADMTKKATNYGLSVKDTHPGLQFLTTPFCATGGFIGGTGYFIWDSFADMVRKGQDVKIKSGDILEVKLLNPIDVPVY